ncbi:hypothetical protein SCM07_14780 [Legionella pneumophila serogroup 1]
MGFSSEFHQERQQEQEIIDRLIEIEDSFDDETKKIINIIKKQGFSALTKEQREIYENDIESELNSRFVMCAGCSQTFDNLGIHNDDDLYFCEYCKEK